MKFRFFITSIVFALAFPLAAAAVQEKAEAEVRLGDLAMETGDFSNAANYYFQALGKITEDESLNGDVMLKLARALLHNGDRDKALEVMKDFKTRYPSRSAGILPGEILRFEKKYEEANSFLRNLLRGKKDPLVRSQILYQLGEIAVIQGDLVRARECFVAVAELGVPEYASMARLAAVFVMIRRGELTGARQGLDSFDAAGQNDVANRYRSNTLRLLLLSQIGDSRQFTAYWDKFKGLYSPVADQLVAEALGNAIKQLINSGNAGAERIVQDAFDWQCNDSDRQDLLRTLFALQSSAPDRAAAAAGTAERYDTLFPSAPDRRDILMRGAALLDDSGDSARALRLLEKVFHDSNTPAPIAISAMRNAAFYAEKGGLQKDALQIYERLCAAEGNSAAETDKYNFGAYLFRLGDFARAATVLAGLQDINAVMLLCDAYINTGNLAAAEATAVKISGSKDVSCAGFGDFRLAEIAERKGEYSLARERFLAYISKYSQGAYLAGATFRAALLAWKSGADFAAAELEEYARLNPVAENAPVALFLAMQAKRDCTAALRIFDDISRRYPESRIMPQAVLQIAEFMIQEKKKEEFHTLMLKYEVLFTTDSNKAEYGLVKLRGLAAFGELTAAADLGKDLMKHYPASSAAAGTAFATGNVLAALGNYQQALECYRRAYELCHSGRFGDSAAGRIADMQMAVYAVNLSQDCLTEAEKIYTGLAADSDFPDIRLQSLFNAGRTLELAGKKSEALQYYEKTLYLAGDLKSRGIHPSAVWCARATYNGVRLLTASRRAEHISRAIRLINRFDELGLPDTGENFPGLKNDLREKLKLSK